MSECHQGRAGARGRSPQPSSPLFLLGAICVCLVLAGLALTLAGGLLASAAGSGGRGKLSLGWARRGVFHVQARNGDKVAVDYQRVPGGDDYIYLFGPDGRRVRTVLLRRGTSGRKVLGLEEGGGTYRLMGGPGHRYRLSTSGTGLILQPENLFPCFFQVEGEGGPYFFQVGAGQETAPTGGEALAPGGAFVLHATNQNDFEGSLARVSLVSPAGEPRGTLSFDGFTEEMLWQKLGATARESAEYRSRADTATVPQFRLLAESLQVAAPEPGFWRVEAGVVGDRADDIGFWLTGTPNLVAPSADAWFVPPRETVRVRVEVDGRHSRGPTGELGVVWDWPSHQEEARRAFGEMGLRADVHFLPQTVLEPENDDGDPLHTNPSGFFFDQWAYRMGPPSASDLSLTSLMALTRPAPWASARPEEFAEYAEAAVDYTTRLPGVNPERLYWQVLNEPNHEMRPGAYAELYRVVGERLRHSTSDLVRRARLGGPAIGNAAQEAGVLELSWARELLREADPLVDFVAWNQYRLPLLEDTWRFAELVRDTRELIRRYDSGGREKEIVIGATNMKGGIVLHNERQDGFYGALWWASVVANALGTGDVRLLNYFYLIDEGSRRKGLLFADGRPKPVARMTALLTRHLGARVLAAESDHSEVEVLATMDGAAGVLCLVLVNKMERPVDLSPLRLRLPAEWDGLAVRDLMAYGAEESEPRSLATAAGWGGGGEDGAWAVRQSLAPRSVLAITLARADGDGGR